MRQDVSPGPFARFASFLFGRLGGKAVGERGLLVPKRLTNLRLRHTPVTESDSHPTATSTQSSHLPATVLQTQTRILGSFLSDRIRRDRTKDCAHSARIFGSGPGAWRLPLERKSPTVRLTPRASFPVSHSKSGRLTSCGFRLPLKANSLRQSVSLFIVLVRYLPLVRFLSRRQPPRSITAEQVFWFHQDRVRPHFCRTSGSGRPQRRR